MKVVVVGASGFIGSHLVDALLACGYKVKAISRHLPGLISSVAQADSNLTLVPASMGESLALQQAMEGADLVFHLASGSLPQSSNLDPPCLNLWALCLLGCSMAIMVSLGERSMRLC